MRDDSADFVREANVWVRERLREFNRRSRRLECADGFCGAGDCTRCRPAIREEVERENAVED